MGFPVVILPKVIKIGQAAPRFNGVISNLNPGDTSGTSVMQPSAQLGPMVPNTSGATQMTPYTPPPTGGGSSGGSGPVTLPTLTNTGTQPVMTPGMGNQDSYTGGYDSGYMGGGGGGGIASAPPDATQTTDTKTTDDKKKRTRNIILGLAAIAVIGAIVLSGGENKKATT